MGCRAHQFAGNDRNVPRLDGPLPPSSTFPLQKIVRLVHRWLAAQAIHRMRHRAAGEEVPDFARAYNYIHARVMPRRLPRWLR